MRSALALMGLIIFSASLAHGQATPLQRRAWAGDSVAMLDLGEAFVFGSGVTKNEDSARYYIARSSSKGYAPAMYLHGTELMTKVFSAKDFAKGMELLAKAADKGNADAQWRLAEEYTTKDRGNEGDKYYDLKKAYAYGDKAAQQGVPEALMFCAEARLKGTGVAKSDSVAVLYFRRAADEKNYVPGIIRMGNMYWEGKVTGKPEPFIAKEWYERVLRQPHANINQKTKANEGIYHIDQFFKRIQNTYLDAGPVLPVGFFDYRYR